MEQGSNNEIAVDNTPESKRIPSARLAAAAAAVKSGSIVALTAIVDPWIPLDPHEQTLSQEKPFRKGMYNKKKSNHINYIF